MLNPPGDSSDSASIRVKEFCSPFFEARFDPLRVDRQAQWRGRTAASTRASSWTTRCTAEVGERVRALSYDSARPWTGPCAGLWQSHATGPLSPACVRVIARARWRARARPGVYTWPDGRRYEGEFVAGLSHGRGEVSRTRADFTHIVVYVNDTRLHFEMQRPSK